MSGVRLWFFSVDYTTVLYGSGNCSILFVLYPQLLIDKVIIDDNSAAKAAVDHLVEQGCRHITYIGGPKSLLIHQHPWD